MIILKITIGMATFLFLTCMYYFFFANPSESNAVQNDIQATEASVKAVSDQPIKENNLPPPKNQAMTFDDQLVKELRKYYGRSIAEKSTQASLFGIRKSILGSRARDGKQFFYHILKQAFPDHADDIMNTLEKLDAYDRWVSDNEPMLSEMSATERAAALWEQRRELFGDVAEELWADEMLATDARKAKVLDTLAALNTSTDKNINEKLEMYKGALQKAYEGSPEEYLLDQKDLLTKMFFSMDSVQDKLKQMSPDQRQQEMNKIRREMGLTQEQIEAMGQLDQDREQRWSTGFKYVQERENVVRGFEGPEREEKLKALREKYFRDEANTIALEEKDGFFRFERQRVYGRN